MDDRQLLTDAQDLIRAESEALTQVSQQLDESFVEVVRRVSACRGRVLVTGAGTSGTMARRLAHLLATCGVAAFFLHPADALHGPSALLAEEDLLIAFSKGGKSAEINELARITKQRKGTVISLTWHPHSELGRLSDVVCNVRVDAGAEGEGVLPFGSTLAAGAVGDALCLLVKRLRGFDLKELTQTHPSGATAELVQEDG
jgi:arabinose-5-phosphate isomerase